ncbi:hypothetical protein CALCODRAFT_160691 [Calocera cornea HHB12733]|uniref:Uncharacterized protein n=1 Tax=Calocera cornea HHB12733 TaxID=1353952 RepID=A0A165CK44_9BASI|nr:hypothetical protein CALCODRAFT_160691 [Calocera cornea HHB12733]
MRSGHRFHLLLTPSFALRFSPTENRSHAYIAPPCILATPASFACKDYLWEKGDIRKIDTSPVHTLQSFHLSGLPDQSTVRRGENTARTRAFVEAFIETTRKKWMELFLPRCTE